MIRAMGRDDLNSADIMPLLKTLSENQSFFTLLFVSY